MLSKLLIKLVNYLPSLTIAKDDVKYLTRFYVFLKDRVFGNIFIHHFHRSDMDMGVDGFGLLHNHPFDGSVSFILSGGYREERKHSDGSITIRTVKPFTFNFISNKDFHRVDLLDEEKGAWSIFFTGSRKNNTWGFWDRVTKEYIDWKQVVGAVE
jgi:hypothetical protein